MAVYTPGVCNIGKDEIRKRYALGIGAFAVAAVFSYAAVSFNLPHWALLFSFIPLMMGFEGVYQGYFHFCAGFAANGKYDFSGSGGTKGEVAGAESHTMDMKKAGQIHLYSIVSGAVVTAIIYFVL